MFRELPLLPHPMSMLFVVAIHFCNPACIRILDNDSAGRVLTLLTGPYYPLLISIHPSRAPSHPQCQPPKVGFLQEDGTNLQYGTAEHAQLGTAHPDSFIA